MGGVALLLVACSREQPLQSAGGAESSRGSDATSAAASAGAGGGGGTTSSAATGGGGAAPTAGFPDRWINGDDCGTEPEVQTWKYSEDTYIFRQSMCTNFEGPFLYLLFGEDKVLLEDTGTGAADVAGPVSSVIKEWLSAHGKTSIELIVAHSHSHGDHIGGDYEFKDLPNTTVVGTTVSAVQGFFGIQSWPTQIVQYDLGGRVLDVIPIPGHQQAHIALYDRELDLLLTGDTLYPGRLYINDFSAYKASIGRMIDFVEAGNPVTWVLGTHIEMSATGVDYAMQSTFHPEEHALELTYPTLQELHEAVLQMGSFPQYEEHKDFIIYPL
jgi:glyoxylase-like metal-dependent hydrolase (beta-lactamase superfamily II)